MAPNRLATKDGAALIEVLIAGIVLGVAIIGVAFMLNSARSFIVAQGDERVALYLGEQKLEQLRALGFSAIPLSPGGPCPGTTCYDEPNLTAGVANAQSFARVTTVDCVVKDDFTTAVACPTPPVLKRLTVRVMPLIRQADVMTLQTVLATP